MMNFLRRLFGPPKQAPGIADSLAETPAKTAGNLAAQYDAAQTTAASAKHWHLADRLSADEANSRPVREELRSRSRYECLEANSYAKGLVHTLALDTIGKGPSLQVVTGDEKANSTIQHDFWTWGRRTKFGAKLSTMRVAKAVDGEAFAELITNRRIDHLVQLDLHITECDQYATPFSYIDPEKMVDGIEFDRHGDPLYYHRLKWHPGGYMLSMDYEEIPAESVIHLFRRDRPGQHRGIPELTTALPLFQHLRRYTLATVSTAEIQAKHTAVMQTRQNVLNTETASSYDDRVAPFSLTDIDYDMFTALPHGWEMKAFDPSQPVTTFDEFVRSILREIARPVHMTAVIALGDASDTSYAGGRLDVQTYQRAIEVEREYWEAECLDRVFAQWFREYQLALAVAVEDGTATAARRHVHTVIASLTVDDVHHAWTWDNREHVDPAKVASSTDTKLRNGTTHRAAEYAARNLDIDEEDAKAAASFGISLDEYRAAVFRELFPPPPGSAAPTRDADQPPDKSPGRPAGEPPFSRAVPRPKQPAA